MRWRENASTLGFVFGALVIGVIGASGYRTVKLQTETVLWIEHTHRVIERIDDINVAVSTAESAVRGYALSRESYLAHELEPQIQRAQSAYTDVSGMMRGNPLQKQRILAFGPKLERRITLLREYLARVSSGGTTHVLPESLQLSAELRSRTLEMADEERRLLGLRVNERTHRTELALELYGIGLGLSGLFVIGAFALMARETRARKRTEYELSQKHSEITLLLQMGELLRATRSAEEAYLVIDSIAPRFFPDEPGATFLRDAEHQVMQARSRWGGYAAEGGISLDDCWGLRRGRPHAIEVRDPHVRCRHSGQGARANSLCVRCSRTESCWACCT